MENHEVLEFVLDAFTELTALHAAATTAAERVRSVLAEHDEDAPHGVTCTSLHKGCGSQDQLTLDPTNFTIKWNGRCCDLGPTILFKLMQRLARRPGRYFTFQNILQSAGWRNRSKPSASAVISFSRR
ncbi:MAG: hypothetical protein JW720_00475, partial [Sedimentisphaerales bacterium]|nr:hypothetical protein [Sedimentisphaerales bacterium]